MVSLCKAAAESLPSGGCTLNVAIEQIFGGEDKSLQLGHMYTIWKQVTRSLQTTLCPI